MSKMSKAVAVLGVVAGLGVAAMPLSTYAAADDAAEKANLQINAQVKGSIALTITKGDEGEFTAAADTTPAILELGDLMVNGPVKTGNVNAVVSSNGSRKIKLTLSSSTTETAMKNTNASVTTNNTIPAIAGSTLTQGTAGWGYSLDDGTTWAGIAANTAPATISGADDATSTTEATTPVVANKKNEKSYKVTFGAAADESVAEGTYTAEVVFTATTND